VESLFLRSLTDGDFTPVDLTSADYVRMADLVNAYGSLTWDFSVERVTGSNPHYQLGNLGRSGFHVGLTCKAGYP
jgi:hypothetical protein